MKKNRPVSSVSSVSSSSFRASVLSFPLPVCSQTNALHPCEKTGEGGGLGEVQTIGYLDDGKRGMQQQRSGLMTRSSRYFHDLSVVG